jgi:hypothetical protein
VGKRKGLRENITGLHGYRTRLIQKGRALREEGKGHHEKGMGHWEKGKGHREKDQGISEKDRGIHEKDRGTSVKYYLIMETFFTLLEKNTRSLKIPGVPMKRNTASFFVYMASVHVFAIYFMMLCIMTNPAAAAFRYLSPVQLS